MSNNAPFVPWMHSLLDRMKELYNKPNARTIAEALPDITGSGADLSAYRTAEEQDTIDSAQNAAIAAKSVKPTIVAISGTTPTITPEDNTIYNCGELISLTISNPPANGAYSVIFTSGATATDLSIPQTLLMPDGFTVEANRIYEINVLANRAVAGSWAVSA